MNNDDLLSIIHDFRDIWYEFDKLPKRGASYDGMTMAEFRAILAISNEGPVTMKQIAERLGVAVSTPTTTIDRLVEKGIVTRTPGIEDRRQLLIELTDEAKEMYKSVMAMAASKAEALLQDFTDEEVHNLRDYLARIKRAF